MSTVAARTQLFLGAVELELSKARKKFPANHHVMNALTEKTGELAQALLDQFQGGTPDRDQAARIYKEAVQVAAMAARVATEGDSTFPHYVPALARGIE